MLDMSLFQNVVSGVKTRNKIEMNKNRTGIGFYKYRSRYLAFVERSPLTPKC